jgi:hypothetical protein
MSSSNNEVVQKQLAELLDELDEESLAKLSDKEVLELRKQLNPYGRTIEGSNKILTFSYTDLQHEYTKKLVTTAMIGFLNTMCDEWRVPDGIPVVSVYDYVRDPSKLDEFEKTLQKPEEMKEEIEENKKNMIKRVAIKEFLEDMFQYNPDIHVRSAYKPCIDDDERNILETPAARLAIFQLTKTDPVFKEDMMLYEREKLLKEKLTNGETAKLSDTSTETLKKYMTEMIPPADVFHRFQYYYDSNYEVLKDIVGDLYCDKPCFETAVNPYAWHDNEDDADTFINKHKDEVISTIFKAHSGKWNIIAPYKKVRESMRFFNKKTVVLEEIAKQIEKDSQMGAELMKKRIQIKKKKNIAKDGADDDAFLKWKGQNNKLKEMGASTLEKGDLTEDCPMDALEVPVFRVSHGGMKITKDKFYTEAVAPNPEDFAGDKEST